MSEVDPATVERRRMQRLRIGVTGLAAVVLLLVLAFAVANTLNRQVASNEQAVEVVSGSVTADNSTEPLAELGVAPVTDGNAANASGR